MPSIARCLSLAVMAAACGGPRDRANEIPGSSNGSGAASSEGGAGGLVADVPTFSDEQLALIAELAPEVLPKPPKDVSNVYADDPKAAALGETFFFEARFSGALLDADNDGGPNSLGVKGESGKVACSGCHDPGVGFLDRRSTFQEISLGTGWTARRTPPLTDVGQAKIVMWGGRHSTLYAQVFGPLENPLEMNSSRLYVARYVAEHYADEYEAVFGAGSLDVLSDEARFPVLSGDQTGCKLLVPIAHPRAHPPDASYECHGMPGDDAEYDGMAPADQEIVTRIVVNVGKAIAAYERTLHCGPSRFDAWAHGDDAALDAAEQRGLALFVGDGKCVSCHSGPYFSDQKFHNTGVMEEATREGILNADDRGAALDLLLAMDDPLGIASTFSDGDDGRLPEVVTKAHEGAFRTPILRCVSARPTLMHHGLVLSLEEAIAFKARGGDPGGYPGESELEPLPLSLEDRRDLVAFLEALGPTND
jgi:cytochrome c peroxidase